jgi:hypothetical protein
MLEMAPQLDEVFDECFPSSSCAESSGGWMCSRFDVKVSLQSFLCEQVQVDWRARVMCLLGLWRICWGGAIGSPKLAAKELLVIMC